MGLLSNVLQRNSLSSPSPSLMEALTGGSSTATGRTVSAEGSLRNTAVFACVRVLAESEASLPLILYRRRADGGKERAVNDPLYEILHDLPNPEMTSAEFRETMMGHLALRGNALAEKQIDGSGRVRALWPLHPDRIEMRRVDGRLVYTYRLPQTEQVIGLPAERVMHIKGLSGDGRWGYSPIRLAMEAVGLALATEEFGARFFGNGARPGAVYEHPGKLSAEAFDRLKASLEMRHQGLTNAHRIAILEEGMKVTEVGVKPDEAQFLETRKFQVAEIARLFRVPPHMIGDLEKATFSNIEQQSLEFVTNTLRPWLVRWEQAIYRDLLTPTQRKTLFVEHLVDGLLRGDIKSRYEAYSVGRQNGWLSANDVRKLENQNPIDGGDVYLVPLNMVPVEQVINPPKPEPAARAETRAADGRASLARQRISRTYRRLLAEAAGRVVNREIADIRRAVRKYLGNERSAQADFEDWLTSFYDDHKAFFVRVMLPIMLSFGEQIAGTVADEIGSQPDETQMREFIRSYVESLAAQNSAIGMQMVQTALTTAASESTDPVEAVEGELDAWAGNRADKIAMRESTGGSGAITRYLLAGAGITRLIWRSNGDTCPYCRALDGKTVGIKTPFFAQGDEFEPAGAERPMTTRSDVFAPPLHSGCDCGIEAG